MSRTAATRDNSTLGLKVALRRRLLAELGGQPLVLEAYGGRGDLWRHCYRDLPPGVVFEKDSARAEFLAIQRPAWAVYEADCVRAMAAGAVDGWPFAFVDLDPWGEPWSAIDALFSRQQRAWPPRLAIAVNDGMRHKVRSRGSWLTGALQEVVVQYGNDAIWSNYLEICQELLARKAGQVGYHLARWTGYYCGRSQALTHYGAILER